MPAHLILTLDYELFGDGSGEIESCLAHPADACVNTANASDCTVTIFAEALELDAFRKHLPDQHKLIADQLSRFCASNNPLALHIHPQWLDAIPGENRWDLDLSKWRVGDLDPSVLESCVSRGIEYLQRYSPGPVTDFRAGGWTIQPAAECLVQLRKFGMQIDSTVAPGTHNPSRGDWYDFRNAPEQAWWYIDNDVLDHVQPSEIIEAPICTANLGRSTHLKALLESKGHDPFPAGCFGTYDGPNSPWQTYLGKISKALSMGTMMLDFSTMPAWALIAITEDWIDRHLSPADESIPLVAIGHNKNFTDHSQRNLNTYLQWAAEKPEIVFSDFNRWRETVVTQ